MRPSRAILAFYIMLMMFFVFCGTAVASGNLNVFIGGKTLQDKWDPVEEQVTGGFESDFEVGPISIAFGLLEGVASDSDAMYDYVGDTVELQFGVKKIFKMGDVRPFIGGGLALISGTYWYEDIYGFEWEDSDSAGGYWASAGIFWALKRFNVGFEAGYSSADITLFNTELDAGGTRFGMLFGYNW